MRKGKILSGLIVSLITIPAIASAAQCTKPPVSDSSCPSDSTFYDSLRFEHKYSLDDYFYARGGTNYIKGLSYEIKEQCDYNDSSVETENGFFYTTDDLRNRKGVLPARTEPYWIITSNDYEVRKLPPQRNMGNLLVKYNVTYNVDGGTNTTHTECGYYEITRCGDGVLDIAGPGDSWESEQCDPADTSHTGWGDGGCNDQCKPVKKAVCNSTYNGQRVTSLTEGNHLCTEGTYGSFKYDSTNHKWTWKCNNELGAGVDCFAIKPYCGDGVKDSGEQCDPADTSHTGWGDGGCNAECKPVKKAVCNSTYNGQRLTSLTEGNHLCTEGTYGNFYHDTVNHKWTWKCNNELGAGVDCWAIEPYCGDGVKDSGEQCDPEDTSHTGWGNGGCDTVSCTPINIGDPVCNSTYHGQRLTSLTEGNHLCTEGTYGSFKYDSTNHKWTWKCNNVLGAGVDCWAIKPYCGDGIKDSGEQCDPEDTSHAGWGDGGCNAQCNPVKKAVCNSTYSGQRITNLTEGNHLCTEGTYGSFKYDSTNHKWTWKCNDELGVGVDCSAIKPYCGDEIVDEGEECDGSDDCSDECKKMYCGDGIKNNGEECDPADTSHAGWGPNGCNEFCEPEFDPDDSCSKTFKGTLRCGKSYTFPDSFIAGGTDRWMYKFVVNFEEGSDLNGGANPTFFWTDVLKNNNMLVKAGQTMQIIDSTPEYLIKNCPTKRSYENLYIEYIVTSAGEDPKGQTLPNAKLSTHKECVYYDVSRCGDGTLDTDEGEICDPADPSHEGWGDGGCDEDCKPVAANGTFEITKTLISDSKYVTEIGQELVWQIKVTAKDGNVKNVLIKDDLPEVLSYVSYTSDLPSGVTMNAGQPTKTNNGKHLEWQTTGTLEKDQSIILVVTTKVDIMPDKDGYENVACAWAEGLDEKCDKKPIEKEGAFEVTKTLISDSKYVTEIGQELVWQIKVTAKDGNVKNVLIKDDLPEVLSYVSYTSDLPSGVTMNAGQPTKTNNGKHLEWQTTGTLEKDQSIILVVTTKVDIMPDKDGYENVACAWAEGLDEKCDKKPIETEGKLKIEKTLIGSKEVKEVGDLISWSIKVTALDGDVTNFKVIDKMPPILGYSGYLVIYNPGLTVGTPVLDGDTVERIVTGTLKEGEYLEIQLTTYVKQMPDKEYLNVACVKIPDEPEICDDEPVRKPILRIKKYILDGDKEVKEKTVKVGDEIVYKVKFGNKGTASATITSIKDFLPKNVEYVSSEIYINGESVHTNNPSGGEVINSNKKVDGVYIDIYGGITLEPGAEGYIIIKGKILSDNKDNRTNFACVYLNDKKPDDSIIDGDRCDDAVHNFDDGLLCSKPEITTKSFTSAGGSTTVTCKASGEKKADSIELDCGNGKTYTGSNISSLSGTCVYPQNSSSSSISYSVVCKVNGETADVCKDTVTVDGTSCFIAGTQVTMADGTQKNIEDVKIGEKVLGSNGTVNTVLGYDRPVLGNRHLWSINGGEYFVSDEHPFMTTEGWKSFNPEMTKLEIDLNTTELKVGDSLVTENGTVKVDVVDYIDADDSTQLYNFVLDGNHTYYANNYLVHNKGGGGPSCDKITTDPDVTTSLTSGKDINVTCTATSSAYILIDCNYKEGNKYDDSNKNFYVSTGRVTTFTGTCKNFTQDSKIQCLVKEHESDSWQSAKDSCGKKVTIYSPCFPAGTKVTMADGTKKNIEDIEEGDMVLSYNTDTNTNESSTVAKTIIHEDSEHEMYELTINGKVLKATAVHPFYVRKSGFTNMYNRTFGAKNLIVSIDYDWVEAQDLKVGDKLLMIDGSLVEIEKINHYPNKETVYNLEVEGNHDYFVDQGYLVHNKSCFLAGTKVIMADGTIKNIEDVKIGEKVLGSNGSINTVLSYDRHLLGERRVWSINGGEYFVSDEHPFMTTEGWKSFVPEKTKEELGWDIPELKVGDVLVTSNGLEKIERVDSKEMDRDTPIYNFVLDGDNTYHANGYLVHNKGVTPSSCFVAGTQVTMADGTKKNIEDVEIGEKLLGSDGSINTVLNLDRHILGDRHIWSINGGEYFVSDEHPFRTTEGWKSFVPEKTKEEIGWTIQELKVGDILITDNGLEKIEKVDSKAMDYYTPIYNFILDGDHTYYADGYLVHNKNNPPSPPEPIIAPMAECFDINANQLSYEQGEILPFYWNLDNLSKDDIWYLSGSFSDKVKAGEKCDGNAEGLVALNSMECSYDIVDSDGIVKKTGNFPCLTEENFTVNPFYQSRLDIGKNKMCGTSNNNCYFDFTTKATKARLWSKLNHIENFGAGWTRFGEYKIRMKKISYLRCNDGEWNSKEKSGESLCESTFMLTNPYTVQKTPSGNFRASTEALSNYSYCEKYEEVRDTNVKPKCLSWNNAANLLKAITASEYKPNEAVNKAMEGFINKYSKLAVSVGDGLKKVPGKNIYFVNADIPCLGSQCPKSIDLSKPTTFVQTQGDTTIKGDLDSNLMLLTKGKIIFEDQKSCNHRQVVKGIFYSALPVNGIQRTPVQKNTSDSAKKRCTEGGLTVKGVLIGNGLQQVMENSRSNLNNWHHSKTAQTVMNGASVVIEYSPSVFTKGSMPPGAEDFTTALSIYKD